jgi:single-strand DNA-binding protein
VSINIVTLVGRAGMDPKLTCFETGKMKCQFSLAVRRPTSRSDEPDWFNLELWGNEARVATDYVKKGSLIGVKGSLKLDSWVDQNGNKRSSPVVRVDKLELLGSKKDVETDGIDSNPDHFG